MGKRLNAAESAVAGNGEVVWSGKNSTISVHFVAVTMNPSLCIWRWCLYNDTGTV